MFTVSVDYGTSMVLVACSGPATAAEICGALRLAGEVSVRTRRRRFLFDLLAIEFRGTEEDRVEIGQSAASLLGDVERIAVVLHREQANGTGERAARQAGLELRNFEDLAAAMEWLAR